MKTILIVEDEAYLAEVLKTRLENNGFGVEVASEGWKGIELAHKAKPDLIILDLAVPVGNGLWILKNLKDKPDTKDIPVVILTGMRDEKYKDKILSEGVSLYMEKPYDGEELVKAIRSILDKKNI